MSAARLSKARQRVLQAMADFATVILSNFKFSIFICAIKLIECITLF